MPKRGLRVLCQKGLSFSISFSVGPLCLCLCFIGPFSHTVQRKKPFPLELQILLAKMSFLSSHPEDLGKTLVTPGMLSAHLFETGLGFRGTHFYSQSHQCHTKCKNFPIPKEIQWLRSILEGYKTATIYESGECYRML